MCETIISEYPLHGTYSDLFCADNHLCSKNTTYNGDEIIFLAPQDGVMLRSYGATNFLIFAGTWAVTGDPTRTMDAGAIGISSGWSGLSLTGAFTSKFDASDKRAMFFKGGFSQYIDEMVLSYKVQMKKPDSCIYREAAKRLCVDPEECIFVGDGGSNELTGAREAGI